MPEPSPVSLSDPVAPRWTIRQDSFLASSRICRREVHSQTRRGRESKLGNDGRCWIREGVGTPVVADTARRKTPVVGSERHQICNEALQVSSVHTYSELSRNKKSYKTETCLLSILVTSVKCNDVVMELMISHHETAHQDQVNHTFLISETKTDQHIKSRKFCLGSFSFVSVIEVGCGAVVSCSLSVLIRPCLSVSWSSRGVAYDAKLDLSMSDLKMDTMRSLPWGPSLDIERHNGNAGKSVAYLRVKKSPV